MSEPTPVIWVVYLINIASTRNLAKAHPKGAKKRGGSDAKLSSSAAVPFPGSTVRTRRSFSPTKRKENRRSQKGSRLRSVVSFCGAKLVQFVPQEEDDRQAHNAHYPPNDEQDEGGLGGHIVAGGDERTHSRPC